MDSFGSVVLEAECLKHGLVIGYSALNGSLCILPPLTITRDEVDQAISLFKKATTYFVNQKFDINRYALSHVGSMRLMTNFIHNLGGDDQHMMIAETQ